MSSPPLPSSPPFTVIQKRRFQTMIPSDFMTFTLQNTLTNNRWLDRPVLRVALLDSPIADQGDESPLIAAVIIPKDKESDWIYCTESGHLQLLLKLPHNVARLILIGNNPSRNPENTIYKRPKVPDIMEKERLLNHFKPMLQSMSPGVINPILLFSTFEDHAAYRAPVARIRGTIVGDFLVEDVELLEDYGEDNKFRRRLRFKSMPNLIQSEAPLLFIGEAAFTTETNFESLESLKKTENAEFTADKAMLVDQHLLPMVAGLFLVASHLDRQFKQGLIPRAFCLGIGGGLLLSFLHDELEFEVAGVEADEAVLTAATQHFDLEDDLSRAVMVADPVQAIQNITQSRWATNDLFDAVFVDLYAPDVTTGYISPPIQFVEKPVIQGLRSLLNDQGVLIINVAPLNILFYTALITELKANFHSVYGIHGDNEQNYVVMATSSLTSYHDDDNSFLKKLKDEIPETYMDSIVKLL